MFDFTVIPENGEPYELEATSRDVLIWEKTNRGKTMGGLVENTNIEDLYKIAHIAARRQQIFLGSLSEFEEQCDIKFEETEKENPTLEEA